MRNWFRALFYLSFLAYGSLLLSSCLSDPITAPQVFYAGIFKPNSITHRDSNYNGNTKLGDLVVRWTRSASDTQANFRGYYIKLFHGAIDPLDTITKSVIIFGPAIDSAHVGRGVHQWIFHNLPIGLYSVAVWGERNPNPKTPDSLALSFDSAGIGIRFDPRPILNPTNLQAVGSGANQVKLHWDLPATDTNQSVLGYMVYARRTFLVKDTSPVMQFISILHSRTAIIGIPSGLDILPEAAYQFTVKSMRADSTFGEGDTSTVVWSGAEQLPQSSDSTGTLQIVSGNGIFIGQNNQGFTVLSERNDSASIQITNASGTITLAGQQFVPGGDDAPRIDSIYYTTPHAAGDYTQTSITLPANSPSGGYVVYATLPNPDNGSKPRHARIWFRVDPTTNSFVSSDGSVHVRVSFQPNGNLLYY